MQELLRPEVSLAGHLGFALKHEGVHLEALSRLFAAAPAAEIQGWVRREPTGRYARRTGFLYEWLTGKRLDVPGTALVDLDLLYDWKVAQAVKAPVQTVHADFPHTAYQ